MKQWYLNALQTDDAITIGKLLSEDDTSLLIAFGWRSGNEPLFAWKKDLSGQQLTHFFSIKLPGTSNSPDVLESVKARLVCHSLIDELSNEALPELVNYMNEMVSYYSQQSSITPQIEPPKQTKSAQAGKRYERPEFHIEG